MTYDKLARGLNTLFNEHFLTRIEKLEKYLHSHTRQRAKQYLAGSMELSLKKETPKGANKTIQGDYTTNG